MTTNDRERERPLLMALLDMMSVSAETNERAQILRQAYDLLEADAVEIRALRKMDSEAATYVESQICMRTHFTGEPPYVGWKGLGLALSECLDRLRALAPSADRRDAESKDAD